MGRPKLAKGNQKIPFPLRLARNDVAAIKRAARRAKMPPHEWARSALTKAANET